MKAPVYLVLLHYPMTNKEGQVITTSVTNLDIHDIARSARTYGIRRYFLVTPIEIQHRIVDRILRHWRSPPSQQYHADRFEALSRVELKKDFEEVKSAIREDLQQLETAQGVQFKPLEVVLTDARPLAELQQFSRHVTGVSYADYRKELEHPEQLTPRVIILGTGWGVSDIFYPEVNRILAPIYGQRNAEGGDYNHLSVRAAAAIILDRLFGN